MLFVSCHAVVWSLLDCFLEGVLGVFPVYMGFVWRLFGCLVVVWWLFDCSLELAWLLFGSCLVVVGCFLLIVW